MSTMYNKYALLIKREVKMTGSALFFFCGVFMGRDEVEVYKNAKKNEVNIQLSWPNKLANG